jgi:tungstate transport system substrate-binding protein
LVFQRAVCAAIIMSRRFIFVLLLYCGFAHAADRNLIRLSITTSVQSSGLLDAIAPAFEKQTGYRLAVNSVGSGRALYLARSGETDTLIVHIPEEEMRLIRDGYATARYPLAKNEFFVVGPADDPAGIGGLADAAEAFDRIARSGKRPFISRADDSGTFHVEYAIWRSKSIVPAGAWYFEAGRSMLDVLKMANERQAYTLVDAGTWLANRRDSPLKLYVRGGRRLESIYSILLLSEKKLPRLNHKGARVFVNWMRSDTAREIIRGLNVDGEPLFSVLPK